MSYTLEQIMDLAKGKATVTRMGHKWPYALNRDEWARLHEAQERGYVVLRGNRFNLGNIWWQLCELREHPYVTLRPRRAYATVELDMLPAPERLDQARAEPIWDLVREHTAAGAGWLCEGTMVVGSDKVPLERAHSLAEAFVELTAPRVVTAVN